MATLSVIVHTKNSAATLPACLKSVQSLADELIVMDMQSTDDTLRIAETFTKNIFHHPDVGYVEPARNKALQKATQEWILILDSDEEISPDLVKNIRQLLESDSPVVAYQLPRKNLIFGRWAKSGWWPDYQVRLFQTGKVTWKPELHSQPAIDGPLEKVPAQEEWAILHHNYSNIDSFLDRAQRYSQIAATEIQQGKRQKTESLTSTWLTELIKRWYFLKANEQGRYGETLAILQSFFEVLAQAKHWEQTEWSPSKSPQKLSKTLAYAANQARYWEAHQQWEKASGLNRIFWRLRMKFRL